MGLTLLTRNVLRQQSLACTVAGGIVVVSFPGVPLNQFWQVDGMLVKCPNTSGAAVLCQVFDLPLNPDGSVPSGLLPIEKTRSGTFDVADESSALTVQCPGPMTFQFSNVDLGVKAFVRIQFAVWQGTQGQPTPIAGAN